MTFSGLTYTLIRVRTPLPWVITRYSYGMIAPYQGYDPRNSEIFAEGENPDGSWEVINLDRYFPYLLGERSARMHFLSFPFDEEARRTSSYKIWAEQLLKHENDRGHAYTSVRISWDEWPVSPTSYDDLRRVPFVERTFITQFP